MPILVVCQSCAAKLRAPDTAAGRKIKCPKCGETVIVPVLTKPGPTSSESQTEVQPEPQAPEINIEPIPLPKTIPPTWRPEQQVVLQPIVIQAPAPAPFDFSNPIIAPQATVTHRSKGAFGTGFGGCFGGCLGMATALIVIIAGIVGGIFFIANLGKKTNEGVPKTFSVAKNEPGSTPSETTAWIDASKNNLRQGDLQVRIAKVSIGNVPLKDLFNEDSKSKDALLMIKLELRNTNPTKKVEYRTWAGRDISFDRDYATLIDNFSNTYKRVTFGFSSPPTEAVVGSESIYPNKAQTDVLVFELPLDSVEFLRLELPAKNFGGTGMLRFQIPKSMIQR